MMNTPLPPLAPPQTVSRPATGQMDQKRRMIVGIGVIVAIALAGLVVPFFFMFYPEYQRDQLVKNGVPAQGEILSVEPTGSIYNNQPQVKLVVRVTPTDGTPYQATITMIINPVYLPQFQPGKQVKVRYDAADRFNVAIEETENGTR